MGKKKSKTSKQKQAKAAAKSLKCRVIKEQQIKVQQGQNGTTGGRNDKKQKNGKRKSAMYCEKTDFQRQQESMRERHMAEEQQRKRMKNNRGKKKNGTKSSNMMFQFQAPTLIVDDAKKSTSQLMSEITTKAQGWDGISNSSNNFMQVQQSFAQSSSTTAISLKQVFQNSTLLSKPTTPTISKSKNRFAALDMSDDDDDDNDNKVEGEIPKVQPVAPLFQFAPARFSIPTTTTSAHDDIDPDL